MSATSAERLDSPLLRGLEFALDGAAPVGVFRDWVRGRQATVLGGLPERVEIPGGYAIGLNTALAQSLQFADDAHFAHLLEGDFQIATTILAESWVTSAGIVSKANSGANLPEMALLHVTGGTLRLRLYTLASGVSSPTDVTWGTALETGTAYPVRAWRDTEQNRLYLQVGRDGTPVFTSLGTKTFGQGSATWQIGRFSNRWDGWIAPPLITRGFWSQETWEGYCDG